MVLANHANTKEVDDYVFGGHGKFDKIKKYKSDKKKERSSQKNIPSQREGMNSII